MGNKEQIYGRNDMVMLDKHNKIYGSLGIVEPYVFDTKTGETIVMENPKKGKFEDVVTEFSVCGKSTQVTTTGAQLLNPKSFGADINVEGCTIRSNGDGSIFISKEKTASSVVYEFNDITDKLVNGKQYAAGNSNINEKTVIIQFVIRRDADSLYASTFVYNDSLDKNVRVRIVLTANDVCKGIISPMVNEGSSAKPYEPYTGGKPSPSIEYPQEIMSAGDKGEIGVSVYGRNLIPETQIVDVSFNKKEEPQILTLKTPNGLSGIPVPTGGNYTDSNGQQWVTDEIDLARGKYIQRVEKVNFDGSDDERWKIGLQVKFVYASIGLELNSKRQYDVNILCNSSKPSTWDNKTTCFVNEYKYFSFYRNDIPVSVFENADNFKAWLVEHPLEMVYQIAEPIERDLTSEEIQAYKELHTNYPTTVIMNDENAGMKVTYKQLESKTRVVN